MSRLNRDEEQALSSKLRLLLIDINNTVRDLASKGYTVEITTMETQSLRGFSSHAILGAKITWQENIAHF